MPSPNFLTKPIKILHKNGQNEPKMPQNMPKWFKKDPIWSEMFKQIVQMRQGIPTLN